MGNSAQQHRQAIGLFNNSKLIQSGFKICMSVLFTTIAATAISIVLLLLCGDIELNPGPVQRLKNLSVCHVNIRGLAASKMLALKTSLCNVFDIITISETFLGPHSTVDLTLPGYHNIIRRDRPTFGGGLAVFISKCISFKRNVNFECQSIENMWIEINTAEGKLLLCNVYRPPNNTDFWEHFNANVEHVKTESVSKYLMILGDLNADFATMNGKYLNEMCLLHNLECHIHQPTRITEFSQTCLDQIISNIPNFISDIIIDPPVSTNDHCTVGVKLKFNLYSEHAYYRHIWLYDEGDYNGFRNALSCADWNECFESNNVDKVCLSWNEIFLNAARSFIPNKSVLIRPKDSPWYTSDLRKMKRKVIRYYHNAKTKMNSYHWEKYKQLRNDYQRRLNEAEQCHKQHLNDSLADCKTTKSWWNTVKHVIGRGNDDSYPPILNPSNNEHICNAEGKASLFNSFFLSHNKIDIGNTVLPDYHTEPDHVLEDIIATDQEVADLINAIDVNKSMGHDGISPRLLKAAGQSIVPSLTRLFNLCFLHKMVPDTWKKANVIPLHKKDDKDILNNYRPVSILPIASKIFERIIFKNVYNFFHTNKLLTNHQSGFRPNDSTVNQLAFLYHSFCEALDKKKDLRIIFCDISKAFDKVWHKGLLYKLKTLGIMGNLLSLLKNYLDNRQQRVLIRGQSSEWGRLEAGVPQGSVLGPLLFLVYINDLVDNITCDVKLFADDTLLYLSIDDHNLACQQLNENLTSVQKWADQWLVNFNPQKTKLMNVSLKKNPPFDQYPIFFNNVQLGHENMQKHLGLTFNDKLTWTNHIDNIIKGVGKMGDVLTKLKYSLNRSTLETIYFSFVRPKLEYASLIWDNCSELNKIRLENVQLKFARIVTGAKRGTSHALLYAETAWATLAERRKISKLKFMFKIVKGLAPNYLSDILPSRVGDDMQYVLRNDFHLRAFSARTERFKRSILADCVRIWNDLPKCIQNIETLAEFKTSISIEHKVNPLYCGINRKLGIIQSQFRMVCSNLNAHLYNLHVVDNPFCLCSNTIVEDCKHFFFECPLYNIQRVKLIDNVMKLTNVSLEVLLYGDEDISFKDNKEIFAHVEKYIEESERFAL